MTERRAWLLAAILILVTLIIGNWDLVTGRAAPQWDAADFFGPAFSLVADHVKAGRLLLWNPWVGGGNPDFAEPELGATSPILLLAGLLSPNPQAGFVFYWLLIWFLGGLGMLLFARSLGAPVWGAAIAALAFITSGLYTGHAEHTSSIYSTSALPWIFWRFHLALTCRRYWFAVQAGALYGLSALGGYPEFTILTPMLLALWALGQVLFEKRRFGSALLTLLITTGLGGVIFSPSYAGIIKSTPGFSDRVGPRPRVEAISSNILPAAALTTFASPYLPLLNAAPNPIWPRTDISMTSIYVGPMLLICSLFAWTKRSRWRWWLAAVTLLLLCCCLGDQLPVRGWLYDLVWPTRYFRNASLFRAYVIFLLTTVAALGFGDLNDNRRHRALFSVASLVVIAGGAIAFFKVVHSTPKVIEGYHFAIAQLIVCGAAIVCLALLFQFRLVSLRVLGGLLLIVGVFDAVATLRISKPTMYTEVTLPWWHAENSNHIKSVNLGTPGLARQFNPPGIVGSYPNNRNVPLRVPIFNSYIPLANRFQEQVVSDPALTAMALGTGRIWFSSHPAWLPPTNSNFELFKQKVHALGNPVLVLQTRQQMLSLGSRNVPSNSSPLPEANITSDQSCSPATISNIEYGPNALSFSYRATEAGWLLITDRWAPDWQVNVNGIRQDVLGGDFIYRAVRVNAGDNQVRFRYRVPYFIALLVLSWSALLAVGVFQLSQQFSNRQRRISRNQTELPLHGSR